MYVTADQLFGYVTALLHRAQPEVQLDAPFWKEICTQAATDAYGYCYRALVSRGFGSVTQAPLWDDGPGFQKAIGAYLALSAGAALGAFDDKFVAKLNRIDELKTVQVTISGQWQTPDGTGNSPLPIDAGHLSAENVALVPRVDDPRWIRW
jgi:hypothetical protein